MNLRLRGNDDERIVFIRACLRRRFGRAEGLAVDAGAVEAAGAAFAGGEHVAGGGNAAVAGIGLLA